MIAGGAAVDVHPSRLCGLSAAVNLGRYEEGV
jgi:hypothetical protein